MRDHLDRPFQEEPPRIRRVPGTPQGGTLLEDEVFTNLLDELELTSCDSSYPLQINFYKALLACDLLLPVPVGTQLHEGLPLFTLENSKGEVGLPIFTNEVNLAEWDDEPMEYMILPFSKLCGYALEARVDFIIVNVAGPCGCEISLRDFSYLAEGLIPPPLVVRANAEFERSSDVLPVKVSAGTPARLGTAKKLPEDLMQRVIHVLSLHGAVIMQAFQFEIAFNEGPLQPAIGILIGPDDQEEWANDIWPNLQAVLSEMLDRHTIVNVFLLNEVPSLAAQVRSLCKPVFVGNINPDA